LEFSVLVDVDEDGFSGGDGPPICGAGEFVMVFEAHTVNGTEGGREEQFIIILSRGLEADLQTSHDEPDTAVFESIVVTAVDAEQFGAAHFKIGGVNAVVDGVLAIDFAIAYAESHKVFSDIAGFGHGFAPKYCQPNAI